MENHLCAHPVLRLYTQYLISSSQQPCGVKSIPVPFHRWTYWVPRSWKTHSRPSSLLSRGVKVTTSLCSTPHLRLLTTRLCKVWTGERALLLACPMPGTVPGNRKTHTSMEGNSNTDVAIIYRCYSSASSCSSMYWLDYLCGFYFSLIFEIRSQISNS